MFEKVKRKSGSIRIKGWEWGYGDLDPLIDKVVQNCLKDAFHEFPPEIYFDNQKTSMGRIYLRIEALGNDHELPEWVIDLEDIVHGYLHDDPLSDHPKDKADALKRKIKLRDLFLRMAKLIDSDIKGVRHDARR